MRVTPEDAKKKFCPMARIAGDMNRWLLKNKEHYAPCLGSECMMWQWDPENCSVGFCGLAENKQPRK